MMGAMRSRWFLALAVVAVVAFLLARFEFSISIPRWLSK
jgi:hypothetical protein